MIKYAKTMKREFVVLVMNVKYDLEKVRPLVYYENVNVLEGKQKYIQIVREGLDVELSEFKGSFNTRYSIRESDKLAKL